MQVFLLQNTWTNAGTLQSYDTGKTAIEE